MTKKLLTEKEVALTYNLNIRTLQKERSNGTGMPYVKLTRRDLYREADVEKYLNNKTIGNHRYD